MELLFIRHGQSTNNVSEGDPTRHTPDAPLTEIGHQQAQHAADYLRQHERHFDRLYCSPMLRCLQTTQPIAQALKLQPHVWVDLHETGGVRGYQDEVLVNMQSMSRSDMATQFPDYLLPDEVTEAGWWHRQGDILESIDEIHERARGVAQEFVRIAASTPPDLPTQRFVVVSHGAFLDAFLRSILFIPPHDDTWLMHYNTGMTKVTLYGEYHHRRVMDFLNRVAHLPASLIT